MNGPQRLPERRDVEAAADGVRQHVRDAVQVLAERLRDDRPQHSWTEAFGRGVHGDDATGVQCIVIVPGEGFKLLHHHLQPASTLDLPVDNQAGAPPDDPAQVALPEPDRLQYACFVRQRGDELVGTVTLLAEGQDHPLRGLPLARHERGNRGQVAAVLIPVGDVVEQVFYRVQAQACELLGTGGTDTFHILGGGVERGPGSRSCLARCDGEGAT